MKKFFVLVLLTMMFFVRGQKQEVGDIVLVGGGSMPPGLFQWIIDHKPLGKFVVVSNYETISPKWEELFNLKQSVDLLSPDQLTKEKLAGVGAILIDGGSQHDYLSKFNPLVLQQAHENGILILGTSAGAMILGEFYFSAQKGTISSEEALANPNEERICIGCNFLKIKALRNTLVDSHYVEREREGRMKVFLEKEKSLSKGIGIDERTALCIEADQTTTVIGRGGVHFMIKSTQGSNHISLYQDDTSSYSRVCGYLHR